MSETHQAFVHRAFPFRPAQATHRRPRICAAQAPSNPQVSAKTQAVVERLREEIPNLFSPTAQKDYSLYDPSVTFEDPLNKFRGISRYAANIAFLNNSPVFTSASLTLYDIDIIGTEKDTVRTRWALSMTANLPWKPVVTFTGQSDYVVDQQSGKVVRHIDYWDSLSDSRFFSLPAVRDLLAQCSPGRVNTTDFGGFQLLRRTKSMEIRRFSPDAGGVALTQVRTKGKLQEWKVTNIINDPECLRLQDVGVKPLSTPLTSEQSFRDAERELRLELDTVNHGGAVGRAFYVTGQLQNRTIYEVWVELTGATVKVDTEV